MKNGTERLSLVFSTRTSIQQSPLWVCLKVTSMIGGVDTEMGLEFIFVSPLWDWNILKQVNTVLTNCYQHFKSIKSFHISTSKDMPKWLIIERNFIKFNYQSIYVAIWPCIKWNDTQMAWYDDAISLIFPYFRSQVCHFEITSNNRTNFLIIMLLSGRISSRRQDCRAIFSSKLWSVNVSTNNVASPISSLHSPWFISLTGELRTCGETKVYFMKLHFKNTSFGHTENMWTYDKRTNRGIEKITKWQAYYFMLFT